jgi:hypothetical protein
MYIFLKKKKIIGHLRWPSHPFGHGGGLITPIWLDGGGQNHPQTTNDNDKKIRRRQEKPKATVLEIRPSIGNLTLRLLEAAKKVVANDGGTGNLTIGGGFRPPPNGQ